MREEREEVGTLFARVQAKNLDLPFLSAIRSSDVNAMQDLIKQGVVIEKPDSIGLSLLMREIFYGDSMSGYIPSKKVIAYLLENGANANKPFRSGGNSATKKFEGVTPIMFLAMRSKGIVFEEGIKEIADLLILYGADLEAKTALRSSVWRYINECDPIMRDEWSRYLASKEKEVDVSASPTPGK